MLLVLVAAALFLFVDARTAPIVLWDESRNVANALEMRTSGLSLVTTYEFQPDLWNTKPPLLIWLMSVSVAIFGTSEWALRLPSAVAALGTLLLVMSFARRTTGSIGTAALAGIFLLLSPGFFGEHGARTADYDALLVFFTTAYLQLLFFAVHKARPAATALLVIGLLIAGAVLTKSTAGLVPGIGVAVYLLLARRWPRLVRTPNYLLMALAAAAPVLLFYLAREAQAPGYIDAAWHNDFAGRFSDRITGRPAPPWTYFEAVFTGWFFAGPLLIGLPLALGRVRGKSRAVLSYSLCVGGAFLVVMSLSSTRLLHYALPAFPALAVAAAIIVRAIVARIAPDWKAGRRGSVAAVALAAFGALFAAQAVIRAADWRYRLFPARQDYAQSMYGELFASLSRRGFRDVEIIDPGGLLAGLPDYAPLLRANGLIWADRGLRIRHRLRGAAATSGASVLASCEPRTAARLGREGRDIGATRGCTALRFAPPRAATS